MKLAEKAEGDVAQDRRVGVASLVSHLNFILCAVDMESTLSLPGNCIALERRKCSLHSATDADALGQGCFLLDKNISSYGGVGEGPFSDLQVLIFSLSSTQENQLGCHHESPG